jgi:hypothetical protein
MTDDQVDYVIKSVRQIVASARQTTFKRMPEKILLGPK